MFKRLEHQRYKVLVSAFYWRLRGCFRCGPKKPCAFVNGQNWAPEHPLLTTANQCYRGCKGHALSRLCIPDHHRIPHGRGKEKDLVLHPSNCWMKRWYCSVGASLSTSSMPSCKNDLKGDVSPGVLWAWDSGANGPAPKKTRWQNSNLKNGLFRKLSKWVDPAPPPCGSYKFLDTRNTLEHTHVLIFCSDFA